MIFSRIEFRGGSRELERVSSRLRDLYGVHQLVWSFFEGKAESRSFIYRQMPVGERFGFYCLSAIEPAAAPNLWAVESKPYSPKLAKGDLLHFQVRVNPVVTKKGEGKARLRHDVVMNAKQALRSKDEPLPSGALLAQQTVGQWLEQRSTRLGFRLAEANGSAVIVSNYLQHRFRRKGAEIRLSTADISGSLEVTQPDAFLASVCKGIGPAKSFGCGLMLLRRL